MNFMIGDIFIPLIKCSILVLGHISTIKEALLVEVPHDICN